MAWIADFDAWLEWRFGVAEGPRQWWNVSEDGRHDPDEDPVAEATRMCRVFEEPRLVTRRFTANQIGLALWGEQDNERTHIYADPVLPEELRRRAFRALPILFEEVFAKLCSGDLGHLNESSPATRHLDAACYMWWDVSLFFPGAAWVTPADLHDFFAVTEGCLRCPNASVQESALHGLGHAAIYPVAQETVERLIDDFLASGTHARPELVPYAIRARSGSIL